MMLWLPNGEKSLKICLFFFTEYTTMMDGRTDRQTLHDGLGRVCGCIASCGKNLWSAPLCTAEKLAPTLFDALVQWGKSLSECCHPVWYGKTVGYPMVKNVEDI